MCAILGGVNMRAGTKERKKERNSALLVGM